MSKLSLPFAEAVPILLPAYEELDLILIGCGGTGGWLAVNLPRIAYLQKQVGSRSGRSNQYSAPKLYSQ